MPLSRLLSIALLAGVPTLALAGPTSITERIVTAGRTQKIDDFAAVDPGCRSMGAMTISLLEPPHAGQFQLAQGREYPNFSAFNTRARFNTQKLPVTQLLYTAAPGYAGKDEFTLEAVGPLGAARRWRYRITVR